MHHQSISPLRHFCQSLSAVDDRPYWDLHTTLSARAALAVGKSAGGDDELVPEMVLLLPFTVVLSQHAPGSGKTEVIALFDREFFCRDQAQLVPILNSATLVPVEPNHCKPSSDNLVGQLRSSTEISVIITIPATAGAMAVIGTTIEGNTEDAQDNGGYGGEVYATP